MNQLSESNFLLYAAANYTSVCYDTDEFYDDLKRFKYLKRLFSRYQEKRDLKERLILNHLITIYNVFQPEAATRMLFFKTEEKHWPILKTFLLFLSRMPEVVYGVHAERQHVISKDIHIDVTIVKVLREL